ncbi:MAG TPA: LysE family transporter [Candidatus Limnocylindria bacterium]|jgi:arginine exporter protein ArgO|nr:LysE family transporter [Candidatus Limnocylindria bacterium]
MLEAAIAGALAGYGIAIPVGAIAVLIIHTGIRDGLRPALAAGAGAAGADGIYATLAVTLGAAAAGLIAPVETPLRLLAGLVLVGLAVRGLVALRSAREPLADATGALRRSHRRTFAAFLGLTLLNPMTVTYFAALVLGLGRRDELAEQAVFIIAAFAASLSWQSLLAGFGALVGRGPAHRLRTPTVIVGNLIILGFGLQILWAATR